MDITTTIRQMLQGEISSSTEWCTQAMEQYPYFTLPILLYLKQQGNRGDEQQHALMSRLAISSPNRKSLYCVLGESAKKFAQFYPPELTTPRPSTENAIDTFLNTFGSTNEKEIEVLNALIFNPMPDYADILAAQEQQSMPQSGEATTKNEQLINDFIAKSKQQEGHFPSQIIKQEQEENSEVSQVHNDNIDAAEEVDSSMFSESLAKIYIKQHKYSKALEIITNISLKFPEKSIYFADQIRFLKKLILNEQIKNNK
ncbi:MAG: hypothetical protein ACI308_06185 [Muribaculaceae bacterium]